MTANMIANARDWHAVVFAMKCVLNERSLPPNFAKDSAGHVAGSYDIRVFSGHNRSAPIAGSFIGTTDAPHPDLQQGSR